MAVNDSGSLLATGTDHRGELIVWNTISGNEVVELTGPNDSIGPMAFSSDGRSLAALAPFGGGVFVWDIDSGDRLARADDPRAWAECCPPAAISFSPDNSRVAVTTFSGAAPLQGEVKLLDITTGTWVGAFRGHEGPVTGVEYIPEQDTIVTSSMDGTIRIWDATTGDQIISTNAGIGQITALDLSEDGQVLLAGGDQGIVKVWTVANGMIEPRVSLPGHRSLIMQVALDPSGEIGASIAMDDSVRVWDVTETGPGEVAAWSADRPVAFSEDGTRIATTGPAGRDVVVRQTSDWQPLVVLENVVPYVGDPHEEWGVVSGITFSPDGARLATTTGSRLEAVNGTVTVWDAATGRAVDTFFEHPYMKGPAAWSGDGRRLAAPACDDLGAPARVWDASSGALLFEVPAARCGQTVDLDHTGRLLAVQTLLADQPNVQVWDVESAELVFAVTHRPQWIGGVAFNPDGTRLLTGGGDGTALLWEVPTGKLVRALSGHSGSVEHVAWSSDGSTVVTGSHDGTVRQWDGATGETLLILGGHGTFPFMGISPDDRYLASGVTTGVQIWALELEELIEIARTRVRRPLSEAECVAYHFETCPTTP